MPSIFFFSFVFCLSGFLSAEETLPFITSPMEYHDHNIGGLGAKFFHRISVQPFNLVALIIFALAILHIFFANRIKQLALDLSEHAGKTRKSKRSFFFFGIELLKLLGEVEVVFGIWVIPLLLAITSFYNWEAALNYLNSMHYLEPLFVVAIMMLVSSRPILKFGNDALEKVSRITGTSILARWFSLLTLGPLLGSIITEPGAMTLTSLLLIEQFYKLKPPRRLEYATLGLLFTNISVGGVLTNFAAPPVLLVAHKWEWTTLHMLSQFGWRSLVGIILANACYALFFRKDFQKLQKGIQQTDNKAAVTSFGKPVPLWITLINLVFLGWIVLHNEYIAMFLGSFLLFLGFYLTTREYQGELETKHALLVGFFLAGLIVHGSLQAWWVSLLLEDAKAEILMISTAALSAIVDNATLTFLATLVPNFDDSLKYAVVAGAIVGGGTTVIANAPNPVGQSLLEDYFPKGIYPGPLFLAALTPTLIMILVFLL